MLDRRTVIALVMVGLVLLFLPKYYELVNPPKPKPEVSYETQAPVPTDSLTKPKEKPAPVTEATAPADKGTAATDSTSLFSDTTKYVDNYVRVETPLFIMTLGSNGQVSGYTLKAYKLTNGEPVSLHQKATDKTPVVGTPDFDFGDRISSSLRNVHFEANRPRLVMTGGLDSIVLKAGREDGETIILTYVINADKYGFTLGLKTSGLRSPETGEYQARWLGGIPFTEPDIARDLEFSAAYAKVGDDLTDLTTGSETKKEFTATGQTSFVAVRSKYFIAAMIPESPSAGVDLVGRNNNPNAELKDSPHFFNLNLRETWKQNAGGRWHVYWGPIKLENLKEQGVGLEETMNWGWKIVKPFSQLVLWSLTGLHKFISNYGIVVVLFSIFVKVVLWPLTRKSQVSMKKMAALQPEIKVLREVHAKNAQAMNQAIMALYKERGVNPASGCVPMILQMPLLYALFIIFRSTIEFRQAPFFGWITDLSQPDVVYNLSFSIPMYGAGVCILPLIMGITQFIMSKRSATDPNQKAMIYIMPVFMTLIFNSFPSGLTLYYTLFNVLAIVEQNLIKVPDFTPSATLVDEPKKKKK